MGEHRFDLDGIHKGDKAILTFHGREVEIQVTRVSECFPYEVPIDTPSGQRPIGQLRPGDLVRSWSSRELRVVPAKLTAVIQYAQTEIVRLSLEGFSDPLETTMQHTFQTSRGLIRAADLNNHDLLRAPDTRVGWRRVKAVCPAGRKEPVFNLRVAHEHNFLVLGVVAEDFTVLRRLRALWHRLFVDGRALPRRAPRSLVQSPSGT